MFLDNVNWKSYRNLPRWLKIGHLARVEQEKNDEDKLIFFSHAKCSGSIRKLVCCADGVRKISPLQGDGNDNISEFAFLFQSKEDKSL